MADPKTGAPTAEELAARLQALVDAKPEEHSLEWAVSAYFLGDVSTLARLSLTSAR
jgi:hypothetical protein